ncbi:trypsin eta-like [Teleopsis dalmanni]|uniref:trypsin eta-like n=1 Tax=Teleopsis dalmanni TaxID=139649 RepID=UPI0018CE3284|nr:trypsin eta-like [Teleopsis dalmanni]
MPKLNFCILIFIIFIFNIFKYAVPYPNNSNDNTRIVGGTKIGIQEAPYLVSLRSKKNSKTPFEHRCTAAIYNPRIVLTTATCVIGQAINQLQVVAGTNYRTQQDGYVYPIDKYLIHPDFNIWLMDNDLAIVHLSIDLEKNKPRIIAAIPLANILPMNGSAKIAGWASTNGDVRDMSEELQAATVEILSVDACMEAYGDQRVSEAMICVGSDHSNGYADACFGDAGSPLSIDGNKLLGLVAWGSGCASKNSPGVYTNIVHFKDWIESESLKL